MLSIGKGFWRMFCWCPTVNGAPPVHRHLIQHRRGLLVQRGDPEASAEHVVDVPGAFGDGVRAAPAQAALELELHQRQLGERCRREAGERWNRQIARWQQSWYCHRCHVAFVAGSAQAVAPEQFGRVIFG